MGLDATTSPSALHLQACMGRHPFWKDLFKYLELYVFAHTYDLFSKKPAWLLMWLTLCLNLCYNPCPFLAGSPVWMGMLKTHPSNSCLICSCWINTRNQCFLLEELQLPHLWSCFSVVSVSFSSFSVGIFGGSKRKGRRGGGCGCLRYLGRGSWLLSHVQWKPYVRFNGDLTYILRSNLRYRVQSQNKLF